MIKIEFEGTDGAGKTTGMDYFIEGLKKRAKTIIKTREVGNPHVQNCIKMRELVLDPESKMSGEAMELVFSAMRVESQKWMNELKQQSNRPDFIISDRGFFSHIAYGIHNTSPEFVDGLFRNLMAQVTDLPDIVIFFNVSPEIAKTRRNHRGEAEDAIELKGLEYQEKVRQTFIDELKAEHPKHIRVFHVDANQDLQNVRAQLDDIVDELVMDTSPYLWA